MIFLKRWFKKFLPLWKDAASGIAEVEDAKERLAGLRKELKIILEMKPY